MFLSAFAISPSLAWPVSSAVDARVAQAALAAIFSVTLLVSLACYTLFYEPAFKHSIQTRARHALSEVVRRYPFLSALPVIKLKGVAVESQVEQDEQQDSDSDECEMGAEPEAETSMPDLEPQSRKSIPDVEKQHMDALPTTTSAAAAAAATENEVSVDPTTPCMKAGDIVILKQQKPSLTSTPTLPPRNPRRKNTPAATLLSISEEPVTPSHPEVIPFPPRRRTNSPSMPLLRRRALPINLVVTRALANAMLAHWSSPDFISMRSQWYTQPQRFGRLGTVCKEAYWVAQNEQQRKQEQWRREQDQKEAERHWRGVWENCEEVCEDGFWS